MGSHLPISVWFSPNLEPILWLLFASSIQVSEASNTTVEEKTSFLCVLLHEDVGIIYVSKDSTLSPLTWIRMYTAPQNALSGKGPTGTFESKFLILTGLPKTNHTAKSFVQMLLELSGLILWSFLWTAYPSKLLPSQRKNFFSWSMWTLSFHKI